MTVMSPERKMTIDVHPLAEVFPTAAKGPAFDALLNDIRANGQTDPILLYEGKILDGRARYRACALLGIPVKVEVWVEDLHGSPVHLLANRNVWRRKLSEEQLAFIAHKYATRSCGGPSVGMNLETARQLFGVPRGKMEAARAIMNHAPELRAKVEAGELAITTAEKIARKQLTIDEAAGPRGNPVKLAPEYETLEEAVRDGVEHEKNNGFSAARASERIGLSNETYRRARAIIILSDNADKLSPEDRELVRRAIKHMNATGRLITACKMVDPILTRFFGDGKNPTKLQLTPTRVRKRRLQRGDVLQDIIDRFEESVEHVLGVCRHADELDVPYLPPERAKGIIEELQLAQGDLAKLVRKLKETCKC